MNSSQQFDRAHYRSAPGFAFAFSFPQAQALVLAHVIGAIICCAFSVSVFAQSKSPTIAAAASEPAPATTLLGFARQKNSTKCLPAVAKFEAIVLKDFEYAFTARADARKGASKPITAVIDARNRVSLVRTLINVTFAPASDASAGCTTIYEQTRYHEQRCEPVQAAMAPNASAPQRAAFGAAVLDLSPTLVLTLIPAGTGQCVSVVKEIDF